VLRFSQAAGDCTRLPCGSRRPAADPEVTDSGVRPPDHGVAPLQRGERKSMRSCSVRHWLRSGTQSSSQ